MTEDQKALRYRMIKSIAERNKKMKEVKRRSKNVIQNMPKPKKKKDEYAQFYSNDNVNHWTDASKYAKQYYGETLHETTKWDNEWD